MFERPLHSNADSPAAPRQALPFVYVELCTEYGAPGFWNAQVQMRSLCSPRLIFYFSCSPHFHRLSSCSHFLQSEALHNSQTMSSFASLQSQLAN